MNTLHGALSCMTAFANGLNHQRPYGHHVLAPAPKLNEHLSMHAAILVSGEERTDDAYNQDHTYFVRL